MKLFYQLTFSRVHIYYYFFPFNSNILEYFIFSKNIFFHILQVKILERLIFIENISILDI